MQRQKKRQQNIYKKIKLKLKIHNTNANANMKIDMQKMQKIQNSKCKKMNKREKKLFYTKKFGLQEGAVGMWHLQPNLNFSWWLNLETMTQVRGQTLPNSQIFIFLKTDSHIQSSHK